MKNNPEIHHRRSIRLRGYDYSLEGAYFVTIVTKGRECLFGEIINGEMSLAPYGKITLRVIEELPHHYPKKYLDEFIIMPNHIHAIVTIRDSGRGGSRQLSNETASNELANKTILFDDKETRPYNGMRVCLSEIVRGFKSFSARRINLFRQSTGTAVWQRNYYEHIIRDEKELNRIRQYIIENPPQWAYELENPTHTS